MGDLTLGRKTECRFNLSTSTFEVYPHCIHMLAMAMVSILCVLFKLLYNSMYNTVQLIHNVATGATNECLQFMMSISCL